MSNASQSSIAGEAREGRKPVVLQVVPELDVPGGTERSTVEIATALEAAGWRALVASAGGALQRQIESVGGRHVTLPLKSKNPIQMRKNARRLAELIAAEAVDIIHARSRAPAWSAWHAAQKTGCHFITTFHGTYGTSSVLKRRYNAIMTKGERVIANSRFTASHILHTYPMEQKNLRIVRRGVDISIYNPGAVTQARLIQLAGQWRLPDGKSVVMLPGRLTAWKGHLVLLDAITHLKRDDFVVVFVGDEQGRQDYRHRLERRIERDGLGHIVRFAGPCRDMPAAYMSADVVVCASTKPEAFGRVIVEGQAMGRPVVAFDHGGAMETILGGETGLLVEPGSASALAQAIAAALDLGAERRKSMAEVAIRHIAENFTLDKMCAGTLAVYEEVLATHAPAPDSGGR
jgi:glycosyltransferase involved in cell wall biosynthesis